MRSLRPQALVAALLIIATSIHPSLLSRPAPKTSQPKRPAPPKRQTTRPQRSHSLTTAIKELLRANPLAPKSPDEKASNGDTSEDEDKLPADDASIKKLIAYWSEHGDDAGVNAPKPSDIVRQRLLEACEDRPELFFGLADCLPENADTHDRLYKLLNEKPEGEETWKPRLRTWLRRNSAYFRYELIKAAIAADDNIYDANEDLRALARLDWNAARPIMEKLASARKAFVTPVALALLYEHSVQEGDSAWAESYRALLKAIVENRDASWSASVEVLASLMKTEWNGQEEWFISLFANPTLSTFQEGEIEDAAESKDESSEGASARTDAAKDTRASDDVEVARDIGFRREFQPGVLATVLYGNTVFRGNADKWLPVVVNLVGHNHHIIRKAAVKCLVKFLIWRSGAKEKKKEIAQKLIPWLTEPNWAAKEDRAEYIGCLTGFNMPELMPGLIWILDYDEDPNNRALAAEALTRYRDPRAIPALRRALEKEKGEEKGEENREKIVTALAECGGFSDDEMATAIEAYAKVVVNEEGEREIYYAQSGNSDEPSRLKVGIGRILSESKTIQATGGLAIRLIERADALRVTHPAASRQILRAIEGAPLRVAEINLVERIGLGWADVDSIRLALETRDALRKSAGDEIYGLIKRGGYAAGVAAVILNDEREWKTIFENSDAKAQLALLACARHLRDKLPVELAGRLLNSPNRELAKAAESYLEVEDSPDARRLVLARHPGEAYILGDITSNNDSDKYIEAVRKGEDALIKEMRGRNGLEAIYAIAWVHSARNPEGVIIRVRGGKAEMSVHETEGRRNVRWLTDGEFEELKSFTSRQEIEDLGPESYSGEGGSSWSKYEYLRLTKEGGLRIALDDLRRAPKNPTPHEELSGLFYRLSRSGEFTTRYNIEDKIPGVEVVFADKNQSVLKVCGEGGEIRALIEENGDEYRRGGVKSPPEWREFSSGKPGEVKDEPSAFHLLNTPSSAPKTATAIRPGPFGQPAESVRSLFYYTSGKDSGIWRVEPGLDPVKILGANYSDSVITPDCKWLVAIKRDNEGKTDLQLIRRNLKTGEEFVATSAQYAVNPRLAYIAAHDKVLVLNFGSPEMGNQSFLLDPKTGDVQPAKGEFRPLTETHSRAPQSTGAPNLFWAAIYDGVKRMTRFGPYDSKNFVFTSLLDFPELELSSDDIWVDATSSRIWFAYKGHLLRLPLPAQMK